MMTKIDLLDRWLEKLGGDMNVLGVYEQGSGVWGFADENSDRDFVVVWSEEYPNKEKRQIEVEKLGGIVHQFQDIPAVEKGVDMFEFENERLNIAHVKESDFFGYYEGLADLGEYFDEQLLRIGGFVNGMILYDPEGKLERYRHDFRLTDTIIASVRVRLKDDLEQELMALKIAAKRGSIIRLVRQTGDVLNLLHSWYYMRKKTWLMSDKWFEAFARKYGWEDEFVVLLRDINQGMEMGTVSTRLLNLAKLWGFEPSSKFRS